MDESIEYGSNITGVGLLLNAEKISQSVDLHEMENKIKSMYIDIEDDDDDNIENDKSSETDILEEYEQAMEDIQSVMEADEEADDEENGEDEDEDEDDARSVVSNRTTRSYRSTRYMNDHSDDLYQKKTRDEHLQMSINRAMEHVPKMNIDMEQEIEDDRKHTLLEQIESLRDDLAELGVSVDGSQYHISYDSNLRRIEEVHRRLTFKYNKLKYNSIAEEALVAGASLLEMVFNGKHEYFGCRPDITGYSDVVKSKLKRIRVETSTAVSRLVTKHSIGVFPRLMMELLPSLITQSQRRKLQAGDSLNANVSYKKSSIRSHISDLNNMLPG